MQAKTWVPEKKSLAVFQYMCVSALLPQECRASTMLWDPWSNGGRSQFLLLLSEVCSCGCHDLPRGRRFTLSENRAEGVCQLRCSAARHIQAQDKGENTDCEACSSHPSTCWCNTSTQ
ncbi:hypothetical protein BDR07DRAFT_1426799 [Suillus spraguei]|nr:hypothetical protein BDR07DRAFT_1426799 [Suillus spraguei]